jgi:hypothetical protein
VQLSFTPEVSLLKDILSKELIYIRVVSLSGSKKKKIPQISMISNYKGLSFVILPQVY